MLFQIDYDFTSLIKTTTKILRGGEARMNLHGTQEICLQKKFMIFALHHTVHLGLH